MRQDTQYLQSEERAIITEQQIIPHTAGNVKFADY